MPPVLGRKHKKWGAVKLEITKPRFVGPKPRVRGQRK